MKKISRIILTLLVGVVLPWTSFASSGGGVDNRLKDINLYNLLEGSIGLKGYDPVSYFAEGGSSPSPGLEKYSANFGGVIYKFANENNLMIFLDEAQKVKSGKVEKLKYEPTYGGWCAFAMASGDKIDIDPMIYDFTGDRLHFFVQPEAKTLWLENKANLEVSADRKWKIILRRGRR